MDKFTALEPVRLNGPSTTSNARTVPSKGSAKPAAPVALIGILPTEVHLLILSYLPIPDFPAYGRCCKATARLIRDESIWADRWNALGIERHGLQQVVDALEALAHGARASAPPTLAVDDEFGEFASAGNGNAFVGSFNNMSFVPQDLAAAVTLTGKPSHVSLFKRAHTALKPVCKVLTASPHETLTALDAFLSSKLLRQKAMLLHLLSLYLSPIVKPLQQWESMSSSLRLSMDRFEATLLSAFDVADGKGDEARMREAAESSWEVWDRTGDWEMGKVWAEKRELFYESGKWDPMANFTQDGLNFDAMHEFITAMNTSLAEDGSRAVRVFPPASEVLIQFADRVATEIVGEYIASLLTRAREISNSVYLVAVAASFGEAWRMTEAILQASSARMESGVTKTKAEDVVYRMFEINMDEYLDEEVESVKLALDTICKRWEQQHASTDSARFLTSKNPAQVKRNVLASFTDVLLLPVTIVPRAVGGAVMAGGNAAVQGIAMLNPQRWTTGASSTSKVAAPEGYSSHLDIENAMVFEIGSDDEEEGQPEKVEEMEKEPGSNRTSVAQSYVDDSAASIKSSSASIAPSTTSANVTSFELLLSLDVALELVHADRESLKRVETLAGYPGHYGHRVRDTIEEVFILVLQALTERHMTPGFAQAIERMSAYKPAEHEETTSVAPLLQFLELVHIGDTFQSMVQVYFDKELAPHIDKTDFLNAVVREKKKFENALDDSVAGGLNAGTEVLMNQVEHIIWSLTQPREYYPPEDTPLELGPTKGCTEAIRCLETHCKLLRGSTSKEVLEVFHQEVGIRLIAILHKHIKRQIISLQGGFQVIADLNTYHSFISSLRVPTITTEFAHLKMLGHVFVVEDAKDLAQIVRDVSRYGGAYKPEDIYEFVQRRADWKKIEKTVDSTMYNLSFKEDCTVM